LETQGCCEKYKKPWVYNDVFMCIYICKLYKIARAFNEQIKGHATLGITPWNCSAGSLLCVNTRVNSTTNGILFNHVCIFLY